MKQTNFYFALFHWLAFEFFSLPLISTNVFHGVKVLLYWATGNSVSLWFIVFARGATYVLRSFRQSLHWLSSYFLFCFSSSILNFRVYRIKHSCDQLQHADLFSFHAWSCLFESQFQFFGGPVNFFSEWAATEAALAGKEIIKELEIRVL